MRAVRLRVDLAGSRGLCLLPRSDDVATAARWAKFRPIFVFSARFLLLDTSTAATPLFALLCLLVHAAHQCSRDVVGDADRYQGLTCCHLTAESRVRAAWPTTLR
jgi:hypothetical protein